MPTPPQAMTVPEEANAYPRVEKIKPLLLGILNLMLTPHPVKKGLAGDFSVEKRQEWPRSGPG